MRAGQFFTITAVVITIVLLSVSAIFASYDDISYTQFHSQPSLYLSEITGRMMVEAGTERVGAQRAILDEEEGANFLRLWGKTHGVSIDVDVGDCTLMRVRTGMINVSRRLTGCTD